MLDSVQQGKLHIKIAKTLPLTQARQAHETLAARKTPGKMVLNVGQNKQMFSLASRIKFTLSNANTIKTNSKCLTDYHLDNKPVNLNQPGNL